MSSDTAKDNASVVDSSVTEWKHEMGNSDDPESEARHCHDQDGISTANKKGKLYNTRYFIIKSLNHQNIQLSKERGIWATQVMNEPILEEAFHNSGRVILIFSVNMSGFFQGYAQMLSSVGWRRDNVWSQGSGKSIPWGHSFKVKWLRLNDLPFQKTLHLKNPLNDYKPVKISRDCQELPQDIGEALCDLIDGNSDVDGMPNSFPRDDLPSKRPCIEPPCSLGDEEYNMPPVHVPWAMTSMPYPSFLYQHQPEASRFNLAHKRSTGVDRDMASRYDVWGLSAESPLASTLTEDDFLKMSYEEYLEVHSKSIKQLCLPATGPSRTMQESSRSKQHDEGSNSSFVGDRCQSRKRMHHSSEK